VGNAYIHLEVVSTFWFRKSLKLTTKVTKVSRKDIEISTPYKETAPE